MIIDNLLADIDSEIARLHQARALLSGTASPAAKKKGRSAQVIYTAAAKPKRKKRKLSAEGRARIVAAVKARWAKQNKAAK